MSARGGAPEGNRNAIRHGLNTLKRRLRVRGLAAIDKRTQTARLLMRWRSALVADLGGEEALSAQEKALVDSATRTMLLLGSVDVYLLEQESIVNRQKRSVLPVVRERIQLQDALLRILQALGLRRRQKDLDDPFLLEMRRQELEERQAEQAATREATPQATEGGADDQT